MSGTVNPNPSDQRQRTILRIGTVYDAGFGLPLLTVPALLTSLLNLPMPAVGVIWMRLLGVCLVILGIIYWIMSGDPQRYLALVGVILLGKAFSIVFYLTYVFVFHESTTFVLFAVLDAIMFALHWWALGPGGVGRIRAAMQPVQIAAA